MAGGLAVFLLATGFLVLRYYELDPTSVIARRFGLKKIISDPVRTIVEVVVSLGFMAAGVAAMVKGLFA